MRRNFVLKKIVKTLSSWESSKLDKKCADEILTMLEELGVISPPEIIINHLSFIDDEGKLQELDIHSCEWE